MKTTNEMKAAPMPPDARKAFEENVASLLRARWTAAKIAKWAATPEAYGRYMTERQAMPLITELLNNLQGEINRAYRAAHLEIFNQFPGLRAQIFAAGGKIRK